MAAQFSIGPSSYPDLFGVEQVTATERIALQFLSMKVDFDQWKADQGSGDRLSANEGRRSEARCRWLWANRFILGVVVAPPLTSRHYVSANAIDVGVTMANGQNRALTPEEFAWMHTQCELRGFTWTGQHFGEPWHIEGATRPEHFPPYPNARELVANGPHLPGTAPAPTPAPAPAPIPKKEHDMIYAKSEKSKQHYVIGETTVQAVSPVRARTYSAAIPGDGNLFQTLSSSACASLIDDARKRRVQAALPVLEAIESALRAEDKPEA